MRGVGEIRDREHRLEDGLQALVGPAARGLVDQQELVVGRLLNLDEVRHLRDFLDFPEKLANALATDKSLRSSHVVSSPSNRSKAPDDSPEGRHPIATVRTGVRRRISRDPGSHARTAQAHSAARRLMW